MRERFFFGSNIIATNVAFLMISSHGVLTNTGFIYDWFHNSTDKVQQSFHPAMDWLL